MNAAASRIVSLLPAATEIVWELGLGRDLVGRSHECDHPAAVSGLPVCTRAEVDVTVSGAEIHAQVEARWRNGLSVFGVDFRRIGELRPSWILTQAQCEVCAVPLAQIEAELSQWTGGSTRVLSLSPRRLADLWENIATVAEALGVSAEGRAVTRRLKGRVADVILRTASLTRRPTVACVEWLEPLMAAGNWVPELVELAGGRSVSGVAGEHSPWWSWDELVKADPDVVILMPCGFNMARTRQEAVRDGMVARPEWKGLRAVRRGTVFVVDGHHYFNRPGPRLVDSLEILAEVLHPDLFPARYRGNGWERW